MTRKQIKRQRCLLNLTQQQLGKRIGMARSTVANFENGHRAISTKHMRRIQKALQAF
jgi:transcriptional regulator with XRE-family HTH domain